MQKFPPPHFPIILETIRQTLNENVDYPEGFLIYLCFLYIFTNTTYIWNMVFSEYIPNNRAFCNFETCMTTPSAALTCKFNLLLTMSKEKH